MLKRILISILITIFFYSFYEILPFLYDFIVSKFLSEKIWKYGFLELLVYLSIFIILLIIFKYNIKWRVKKDNRLNTKNIIFILLIIFTYKLSLNSFISVESVDGNFDSTLLLLFSLASVLIIQPINEELIFRQVLFKIIHQNKKKYLIFILISSLLFSAFHINLYDFTLSTHIIIFILGIILSSFYMEFGFYGGLLGHFFYNFIWVLKRFFDIDLLFIENYYLSFTLLILIILVYIYNNRSIKGNVLN